MGLQTMNVEPSIDQILDYLHNQGFLVHHLSQLTPATWAANIKIRKTAPPNIGGQSDGFHAWRFYTGSGTTPYKAIVAALANHARQSAMRGR